MCGHIETDQNNRGETMPITASERKRFANIAWESAKKYYWDQSEMMTPRGISPMLVMQTNPDDRKQKLPDPDNTQKDDQRRRDFIAAFRYNDQRALQLINTDQAVLNCDQFLHVMLWKAGILTTEDLTKIANAPASLMTYIFSLVKKSMYQYDLDETKSCMECVTTVDGPVPDGTGHIVWKVVYPAILPWAHIGIRYDLPSSDDIRIISLQESYYSGEQQYSVDIQASLLIALESRQRYSQDIPKHWDYFHTDINDYVRVLKTLIEPISGIFMPLPTVYPSINFDKLTAPEATRAEALPELASVQRHNPDFYRGLDLNTSISFLPPADVEQQQQSAPPQWPRPDLLPQPSSFRAASSSSSSPSMPSSSSSPPSMPPSPSTRSMSSMPPRSTEGQRHTHQSVCNVCKRKFFLSGTLRHHCSICGQCVCINCAPDPVPPNDRKRRICKNCSKQHLR